MAAADALLDPLWIPGQVVVNDQGTELEVDAFRCRFGCDKDIGMFAELINQRSTAVDRGRARDAIRAGVFR